MFVVPPQHVRVNVAVDPLVFVTRNVAELPLVYGVSWGVLEPSGVTATPGGKPRPPVPRVSASATRGRVAAARISTTEGQRARDVGPCGMRRSVGGTVASQCTECARGTVRKCLWHRRLAWHEGRSEERRVGKECRSRWSP